MVRTSTAFPTANDPGRLAMVQGCATLRGLQPLPFLALPGDLAGQALIEADARLPSEMPVELGGVGAGIALVAWPGRLAADGRALADEDLELVQDFPDCNGLAAADVIDLAGKSLDGS